MLSFLPKMSTSGVGREHEAKGEMGGLWRAASMSRRNNPAPPSLRPEDGPLGPHTVTQAHS